MRKQIQVEGKQFYREGQESNLNLMKLKICKYISSIFVKCKLNLREIAEICEIDAPRIHSILKNIDLENFRLFYLLRVLVHLGHDVEIEAYSLNRDSGSLDLKLPHEPTDCIIRLAEHARQYTRERGVQIGSSNPAGENSFAAEQLSPFSFSLKNVVDGGEIPNNSKGKNPVQRNRFREGLDPEFNNQKVELNRLMQQTIIALCLTQMEVAAKCEFNQSYISRIVNATRVETYSMYRLIRALIALGVEFRIIVKHAAAKKGKIIVVTAPTFELPSAKPNKKRRGRPAKMKT